MKNVKELSRKDLNAVISAYLLNCIPSNTEIWDQWQVLTESDKDRVNFVFNCFNSEYGGAYYEKQYPNTQDRLKNWFMGLPSAINVDFENYKILELARQWGQLPEQATAGLEQRIIDNWFSYMAAKLIALHNLLNKTNPRNTKK